MTSVLCDENTENLDIRVKVVVRKILMAPSYRQMSCHSGESYGVFEKLITRSWGPLDYASACRYGASKRNHI